MLATGRHVWFKNGTGIKVCKQVRDQRSMEANKDGAQVVFSDVR